MNEEQINQKRNKTYGKSLGTNDDEDCCLLGCSRANRPDDGGSKDL
jgi:hypothetical protein